MTTMHIRHLKIQHIQKVNNTNQVRTAQKTLSVLVIKTRQLMLYREVIIVCSAIRTEQINTLCGQNVELLSVKPCGG